MIINDWEQLSLALNEEKAKGKRIIFTNGCFDLIHPGHVSYLNESKSLGDILVVALNSDDSVKKLKGESRPLNSLDDRSIVMDALKPVDYVTYFSEDTPLNVINKLIPDVITKGGDYKVSEVVGGDTVIKNGGNVVIINFVDGKSTTKIINKMNS